jgi:hypothetical protein
MQFCTGELLLLLLFLLTPGNCMCSDSNAVFWICTRWSPLQDQLPAGLDERRKWVWFKALKWVLHITYRLFNRWALNTHAVTCVIWM